MALVHYERKKKKSKIRDDSTYSQSIQPSLVTKKRKSVVHKPTFSGLTKKKKEERTRTTHFKRDDSTIENMAKKIKTKRNGKKKKER